VPFRDVAGHRRLIALLSRASARATLPPSLIFTGPAGIGKRLVASALAQAVNCLNPVVHTPAESRPGPFVPGDEIDACGVCAACTRIARGVHPDVLVVEPGETGTIKIEQIRDVVDRAAYRPFEGRRRVVIVDEADAMQPAAQNALLKTLEEPPPASSFILITSRPDVLLPTVRSRCPMLRFQPLDDADVARVLMARGLSDAEARAAAAAADGSVGHALQASAGDLLEARSAAHRVLAQVAGRPDPRRRIESAKDLVPKASAGATERDQLAIYLRAIATLLRDIELLAVGADRSALANPDMMPELERLAPAYAGTRAVDAFAAVDRALVALERNAGAKIVADWLALEI